METLRLGDDHLPERHPISQLEANITYDVLRCRSSEPTERCAIHLRADAARVRRGPAGGRGDRAGPHWTDRETAVLRLGVVTVPNRAAHSWWRDRSPKWDTNIRGLRNAMAVVAVLGVPWVLACSASGRGPRHPSGPALTDAAAVRARRLKTWISRSSPNGTMSWANWRAASMRCSKPCRCRAPNSIGCVADAGHGCGRRSRASVPTSSCCRVRRQRW